MTGPPSLVEDPGVSNGVGNPWESQPIAHLGRSLFLGKCGPALRSCQALGLEVRNSKGEGAAGRGDPEDAMEARRSRVQDKGRVTVKQEPERHSPDPVSGWNPQPWGEGAAELRARQGAFLSWGGAHFFSPGDSRGT